MIFNMRNKLYCKFIEMAEEIERIYGVPLEFDDDHEIIGYHCPYCSEPVLFEDWVDDYLDGQDMNICPICEEFLEVN